MKRVAAALILCLGLAGCSPFGDKPDPVEEEKPQPKYIGQISSVHASQQFVLIRRSPGVNLPQGTILISTSINGSAANLRVSGESLGQMIAADIQSGSPQVGDSVRESLIKEAELEPESPEIAP